MLVHRKYVLFMRSNKKMNKFLQKKYVPIFFYEIIYCNFLNIMFSFNFSSRFLYPGIIALIVSSLSYPLGPGKYMAGELSTHDQVTQLFSNFTWTNNDLTVEQDTLVNNWRTDSTNVFVSLTGYLLFTVCKTCKYSFVFSLIQTFKLPFTVFLLHCGVNHSGTIGNVYSGV